MHMHYFSRILCTATIACAASTSFAFGLKTHIWIGQSILAEIQSTCRVEIETVPVKLNVQVCESIRANPNAFLSGVLGPDAYPDLITGQVTTHPGIEGDWATNDWLKHLYANARPGPELAFAAGYVVHAASDIFAHTYVNGYSGDIFILTDERAVERRHFVLEKYIDSKLPDYNFDPETLAPPAEFLRDKLIHNADAARLASKSGFAYHITLMHEIHRDVGDVNRDLQRTERDAGALIGQIVATIIDLDAQILTMQPPIKAAREVLSAQEAVLQAEQKLYDDANNAFQRAATDLQNNEDLKAALGAQARLAREAADAAQKAGIDASNEVARFESQLIDLRRALSNTPATVSSQVCNKVNEEICSRLGVEWACKIVCKTVNVANDAYTRLTSSIADVEKQIVLAQTRIQNAAITAAAEMQREQAALQSKAQAEALTAGLQAAKAVAQAAYDLERARYEPILQATEQARSTLDKLLNELKALQDKLVDSKSIKQAIEDLIASSKVLSFYTDNWVRGMDKAGAQFILASNKVAQGMLEGHPHILTNYSEWWKCYGHSYTPVPPQVGEATCAAENFLEKTQEELDKLVERVIPPPFDEVFREYKRIKTKVKTEIKNGVNQLALELIKLTAPDGTTKDFIDLLAKPENASREKLNGVFAVVEDSGGKQLLTFTNIASQIDDDLHLQAGALDPRRFAALKNAQVLSRISLMDRSAIQGLVWVLGGPAKDIHSPTDNAPASVLFDTVRSIDGNHQWQPYGLPYQRSAGGSVPTDAMHRHYGFGPNMEHPGLELFIDPHLREIVFKRVFEGKVSGALAKHPAMQPGSYAFAECNANPFPLAFKPTGEPATADNGCDNSPDTGPERRPQGWEFLRRILNWLRLNPYSPF
jgi:hypothetical protein